MVPLAVAIGANLHPAPAVVTDPVASLTRDVASGAVKLAYSRENGYLSSVLQVLKIDPSSQTLVFSKTSLQSRYITRKNPRAIYFNDHTYVGYIPGAPLIEIMSVHPTEGARFYSLPNLQTEPNKPVPTPKIQPETTQCTRCHGGGMGRVAALFTQSVFASPNGYPRIESAVYDNNPDLPLNMRWGGWYVSGTHGNLRHLGNEPAEGTDTQFSVNTSKGANVTDLRRYFDVRKHLSPASDIAALMVLERQMDVQNELSLASNAFRRMDPSDQADVQETADRLVRSLLASDEVKLTAPIVGTTDFAKRYGDSAPKDPLGRSLSQLDLKRRVLRYGCSPLIYSASFAALPDFGRRAVLRRLFEVLDAPSAPSRFAHLSAGDRRATSEILRATLPEYAAIR